MKTGALYEHYGSEVMTFQQQEKVWRILYDQKRNSHCYEFLEDWTPGMFDDQD